MKQNRKVRFELSWGGVAGIMAACVCICLWMFVLGVWTGQALLQPPSPRTGNLRFVWNQPPHWPQRRVELSTRKRM